MAWSRAFHYITGFCKKKKICFADSKRRAQLLSNGYHFFIFGHQTWDLEGEGSNWPPPAYLSFQIGLTEVLITVYFPKNHLYDLNNIKTSRQHNFKLPSKTCTIHNDTLHNLFWTWKVSNSQNKFASIIKEKLSIFLIFRCLENILKLRQQKNIIKLQIMSDITENVQNK